VCPTRNSTNVYKLKIMMALSTLFFMIPPSSFFPGNKLAHLYLKQHKREVIKAISLFHFSFFEGLKEFIWLKDGKVGVSGICCFGYFSRNYLNWLSNVCWLPQLQSRKIKLILQANKSSRISTLIASKKTWYIQLNVLIMANKTEINVIFYSCLFMFHYNLFINSRFSAIKKYQFFNKF
jgi:hypothetical protein